MHVTNQSDKDILLPKLVQLNETLMRIARTIPSLQSVDDEAGTNTTTRTRKRYAGFLSHYKREAGTEARLVQQNLSQILPGQNSHVFLDSGKNEKLTDGSVVTW